MSGLNNFIRDMEGFDGGTYEMLSDFLKKEIPEIKKLTWFYDVASDEDKAEKEEIIVWLELDEIKKYWSDFERKGISPYGLADDSYMKARDERLKIEKEIAKNLGLKRVELYESRRAKLRIEMDRSVKLSLMKKLIMFGAIDLFGSMVAQDNVPHTKWNYNWNDEKYWIDIEFYLSYGS